MIVGVLSSANQPQANPKRTQETKYPKLHLKSPPNLRCPHRLRGRGRGDRHHGLSGRRRHRHDGLRGGGSRLRCRGRHLGSRRRGGGLGVPELVEREGPEAAAGGRVVPGAAHVAGPVPVDLVVFGHVRLPAEALVGVLRAFFKIVFVVSRKEQAERANGGGRRQSERNGQQWATKIRTETWSTAEAGEY